MNLIAGRLTKQGEHPKAAAISQANDLYVSSRDIITKPCFLQLQHFFSCNIYNMENTRPKVILWRTFVAFRLHKFIHAYDHFPDICCTFYFSGGSNILIKELYCTRKSEIYQQFLPFDRWNFLVFHYIYYIVTLLSVNKANL